MIEKKQQNTVPMKELFKLIKRYDEDKVDFAHQSIDRQYGGFNLKLIYDKREFKDENELYNYIVEGNKELRKYSEASEFKDIDVIIDSMVVDGNKITSYMHFTLGYEDFKIKTIKEVI